MAYQPVNIGAVPDDGTGDTVRDAFEKANANFTELYAADAAASAAPGLYTLNTLSAGTQTLSTGTSGSDFTIASSGANHAFNLPFASAASAGKLSAADWITFNAASALASSGSNLAWQAYNIAQAGTLSHTTIAYASTIAFDFDGRPFQSATVTGNTYVTVINAATPTTTRLKAVSARLIGDSGSHIITLNDFTWFGTQPSNPYTLAANKSALISFTSYGSTAAAAGAVLVSQV